LHGLTLLYSEREHVVYSLVSRSRQAPHVIRLRHAYAAAQMHLIEWRVVVAWDFIIASEASNDLGRWHVSIDQQVAGCCHCETVQETVRKVSL